MVSQFDSGPRELSAIYPEPAGGGRRIMLSTDEIGLIALLLAICAVFLAHKLKRVK